LVILKKPQIDLKTQQIFDKFIKLDSKNLPQNEKFIKTLTPILLDKLIEYISWKYKVDIEGYDEAKKKYKFNKQKFYDWVLGFIVDFKQSYIWLVKNQHELVMGIYLGELYQIKYLNYEHDPFPLALFLNSYDKRHENFHAINLHYLKYSFRDYFLKTVLYFNKTRINNKKDPIVVYDFVKKIIPTPSICYRNYKARYIRVIEKINHHRWLSYLKIDLRSVYHYH